MPITRREIEAARTRAKRSQAAIMLWDDELKGFGCRVAPSGKASWLVRKRLGVGGRDAKIAKHVIGDYSELPPDKARDRAIKVIAEIRSNIDLVARRKQQRVEQREQINAPTLTEAWELYLKRRSTPGRFWSELRTRFDGEIIPRLGRDTKLASLTKQELRHLIENKEEAHPAAARTLFEALRPFFKWCVERDLIPVSPLQDLKAPPLPESRDRILSDAELKAFWKATGELFLFGPFYRLLLLTGQRREEVGAMQWQELDLDQATWTIPKERTKNSKEHLVHLSPQALAILRALPKPDSPFVFTTTMTTPISGYGRAKTRLDELMQRELGDKKLAPWRVHDLRRTAASGMARLGFQPHVVERVLNHVSGAQGGLVGVYQRYEYQDERRRAVEAWSQYVDQLISPKPVPNNVVTLVRA